MKNRNINNITAYILLAVAIVFCICGVADGEAEAVLRKAVAVCMECCGIG